ncbi:hypothetical protein GCM10010492_33760 [Saccharothrix mutabilis subsp. mutabilis]|uniref:Uncharacterized protein n=1 Tax=Saccharothrix mutabilis subsp. mutabilis TaxID=66855 RepID=A0ABP3DGU3_9PSEU
MDVPAPELFEADERPDRPKPGFGATPATVLLPVVLMIGKALADIVLAKGSVVRWGRT